MKVFAWRGMLTAAALALLCSGCGFFVQMTTTGAPGGVAFNVKVTNASQCPMAPPGVLVLPFFALSQVPNIPPQIATAIEPVLSDACSGRVPGQLPPNVSCEIIGTNLICLFVTGGDVGGLETIPQTTSFGIDQVQFNCQPDGSAVKCTLPLSSLPHATGTSGNPGLDVTPICLGVAGATICVAPVEASTTLPPGGMATSAFTLPKPPNSPNQSFVFPVPLSTGVCKQGTPNQGQPCGDLINTIDCGNNLSSDCGSGICQGGSNDGFGCNSDTDCPGSGATCAQCFPTNQFQLSFACATYTMQPTPALSWSGMVLAIALLGIVGVLGLRWRTGWS